MANAARVQRNKRDGCCAIGPNRQQWELTVDDRIPRGLEPIPAPRPTKRERRCCAHVALNGSVQRTARTPMICRTCKAGRLETGDR